MVIILGVILRYKIYVIPKYQIEKQDKPKEEAKSSCFTSCLIIFVFSVLIVVQCINLHNNSINIFAQNDSNTINDFDNISNSENIEDYEEDILSPLDKMIEEYVLYSEKEVIPIEELESLSDNELYYIRNGIFAYAGQKFKSGYYDKFSWYTGNVSENDVWLKINPVQLKNIENIHLIEEHRKK